MRFLIALNIILYSFSMSAQDHSAEKYLLKYYEQEAFDKVVEKADSILANNNKANLSRIYQIKADALYFLNDVEASLQNYLLTIEYLEEFPVDTVYLIESYSHTGFCYKYLGKFTEAIPYYEKALQICRQVNDSLEIANQLSHLGEIKVKLNAFAQAKAYYEEAYEINFNLKDSIAFGYDLVDLGDLKFAMKEYDKAIEYYQKGILVHETRANNHNTHILRMGKLSHAFLHVGQSDSAMYYINQALNEAEKLNDSLSMAKHWIIKAEILAFEKDFDSALWYGNSAKDYFHEDGYSSYKTNGNITLADIYIAQRNLRKAKTILITEKEFLEENKKWDRLFDIYTKLIMISEQEGNYKAALDYSKSFRVLNDSILQKDKLQTILSLETSFNTKQKEQEIELLKSQEKLIQFKLAQERKNIIVLGVMLILVVFIAIFIYFSIRKKHQLERELLSAQINEMRSQLKMLIDNNSAEITIDQDVFNEKLDNPLSTREIEVLTYALSDLTNQEIADKVFVSVNTVKFHLKNIYEKLGVSNRKEVIKFALSSSKLNE
ncbi:hypothetical protein MATR_25490 [Marivirga tractuosa]|uniref:ATP-dependent transcriptional regulator, MalT-like, LuxR family n=1 Tax=Marivirga tractuosa (strain ATCC 23168 / DSM 4126 / NBRC 15989 / NCIMB 1408 / VKM B-1430 / H-43) TaxID=643867 RepID=E4TPQ9_MARTH|nr:tetratricopeptide repeat protein [Marivirga tractuosa]ADR23596.1 ATP-dependent transcriptional regulator, MalT-like, LuxR family [Marivirga tractuosa DSM 4126]BDD15724.1 hypothetical protein MATR_25490 [Marivirga tractuosa]